MKKLLMAIVLVVCAIVGSAQGLPRRTLGRRSQRPVVSVAREKQVALTNGVEWTYRIATFYKNDGDVNRGGVLGGDSSPWRGAISKDVSGVLDIPDSIAGMPVVAIGEYAFHSCFNLTSVTIPLSVETIGESAFGNCTGLTSVTIPLSVKSIGPSAFSGCSGLTSVVIPSSVKSIGMSAFSGCSGLTTMMIPEGVTNIAGCAFLGCNRISSFRVSPENQYFTSVNGLLCTKDGKRVIAGVNGNVMIPKGVTEIGEGAFSGCASFVVSPENQYFTSVNGLLCTKDGKRVIAGVNGDVTIPKSVMEIGENAFSDCKGLTSVVITPNVTNIGEMAFGPCDELANVKFCGERPGCKEDVFFGCEKLKSIQVPAKCKSWAGMKEWQGRPLVFYGQNNAAVQAERHDHTDSQRRNTSGREGSMKNRRSSPLASAARRQELNKTATNGVEWSYKIVDGGVVFKGSYCSCGKSAVPENTTGELIIPDVLGGYPVRCIGEAAFRYCMQLTSVTIPGTVTSIEGNPFSGCGRMESFVVAPDNPMFSSVKGLLCTKDGKKVIAGVKGDLDIPDGIMSIGLSAFYCCSGLTSVTIPSSVKTIEPLAFYGCSGLSSVTIPEGVTTIGGSAFGDCYKLTSVAISSSVTNIGKRAFSSSGGRMTSIAVSPKNPNYKSLNGLLCSKDGKVVVAGVDGDVVIPEGVTSIGDDAFYKHCGLTSVRIPASVMTIGNSVFEWCSRVNSFSVSSKNPKYESANGLLCTKDGRTVIAGINGDVVIPEGVTEIVDLAFSSRNMLTSVTIPASVARIGNEVFRCCRGLALVTIRGERPISGSDVFSYCNKLKAIHVPANAKSWSGMKEWQGIPLVFDSGVVRGGLSGGLLRARRLQRQQEAQSSAAKKHAKQESKDAEQQRKVEMEKK